jgi:hypothetical protein
MSLTVRVADFQLLQGELAFFERESDSGHKVNCAFCPKCGIRIYHQSERMGGAALNIKPGTFDDTSWLTPRAQAWTIRKQPWLEIPAGLTVFERQP